MKYPLCLMLWLWFGQALAQQEVSWPQLSEVRYAQSVNLSTGYITQRPRFSKAIRALEGQTIEISGYILPLDVEGEVYVLSRYPYAACFFCGGAGLESVMDVWFADLSRRYRMDQQVTLRGVLHLSDSGEGLMYLLDEAAEVK